MFVRTKVFKNRDGSTRTYLQIVKGERVGGKVRQIVVANLGRLDELRDGGLGRLVEGLARFSRYQAVKGRASEPEAAWAKSWGPALVFGRLWEELGLPAILERLLGDTVAVSDYGEAIFAMTLNRLCDPASKLRVSEWVQTVYRPEWERLELQHFYRALDLLTERKTEVETQVYDRASDLFNLELDLVLWDTTSTYFEGRVAEGLTEFGFSKDKRPDRAQIMVGVLMSRDGFPVAHEVFPGDTEVETFRHVLAEVRTRFNLGRVILVADRGMVSEKVLGEIEKAGLEYIVGVRMRKLSAAGEVLSRAGRYREVCPNLKVKEVLHEGRRYVVFLNPEEAGRDAKVREEALATFKEKLRSGRAKQLIGNSAFRRYLKLGGDGLSIDTDAVEAEARYDGKYVLRTNSFLSPEDAALAYKSLWRVERAFRELKSGLDLRPVYHWTEKRIRGHVMVCFLALVLKTALRRKLAAAEAKVHYDDLLQHLTELRAVEIHLDGRTYLTRTELAGHAPLAFKALGLQPPAHVSEMPRH